MIFWRISRFQDLRGAGGLKAPGRWHFAGQPVVYLAEHPAAALLEVCAHTAANDVPPEFTLLRVVGPTIKVDEIKLSQLPHAWQQSPELTQKLGTEWLRKGEAVLLRVPSAIVPETSNYLFNPAHRSAKRFRITATYAYPFDVRLKR
ncbi:RES family NAD+ phosphorylase [Terriglobus tenax]|uniref:RES family NAD+ phosphorylase n=1 Tax=Terriglobus tenax TaxID=1111115 RepID=UPI0021E0F622|nr:RES family NAD+ phosphorylase [Terriglobus tenax]